MLNTSLGTLADIEALPGSEAVDVGGDQRASDETLTIAPSSR